MGFCLVIIAAACAQGLIFLSLLDVHRLTMQPHTHVYTGCHAACGQ